MPRPKCPFLAAAKAAGALTYFTGRPCKHGHVSERLVTDRRCRECLSKRDKDRWRDPVARGKLQAQSKQRRDANPGRDFGMTAEQYAVLVAASNGRCAICDRSPGKTRHHIDHDHDTGLIRGLLCHNCNRGLGYFLDQPNLLRAAAAYLERYSWLRC